jgi:hypothetical protein
MPAGTAASVGTDLAGWRGWRPLGLFDCSGWEAIWEAQSGGWSGGMKRSSPHDGWEPEPNHREGFTISEFVPSR